MDANRTIKRLITNCLRSLGYTAFRTDTYHAEDGFYTLHHDRFRADPAFARAYDRGVKASNGIEPGMQWRVHVALWAASTALQSTPTGDFIECGVNAGFVSSAVMNYLNWNLVDRDYWLLDTFAGPPLEQFSPAEVAAGRATIAQQRLADGAYVTDLDRVRENFSEWPRAKVIQGRLPEALSATGSAPIAFLHIDLNCAEPEVKVLEQLWPRLAPGAMILLDDYAYHGHHIQGDAMDACCKRLNAKILALPTGQGLIAR